MRLAQVQDVVVGEIPLTVAGSVKDGYRAVGQGCHHSALHMAKIIKKMVRLIEFPLLCLPQLDLQKNLRVVSGRYEVESTHGIFPISLCSLEYRRLI